MKYCQNTSQLEPDSIHDLGFMVLKYKADLIYYQRNYLEASELYKKVLAVVPRSNGCVTREIREALVRCYLRLEQGELAQLEAEHLVSYSLSLVSPDNVSLVSYASFYCK